MVAGPEPGDTDLATGCSLVLGTPSSSVNSVGRIPSSGRGNDSLVSLVREKIRFVFLTDVCLPDCVLGRAEPELLYLGAGAELCSRSELALSRAIYLLQELHRDGENVVIAGSRLRTLLRPRVIILISRRVTPRG